jgi:hypothetical protein
VRKGQLSVTKPSFLERVCERCAYDGLARMVLKDQLLCERKWPRCNWWLVGGCIKELVCEEVEQGSLVFSLNVFRRNACLRQRRSSNSLALLTCQNVVYEVEINSFFVETDQFLQHKGMSRALESHKLNAQ